MTKLTNQTTGDRTTTPPGRRMPLLAAALIAAVFVLSGCAATPAKSPRNASDTQTRAQLEKARASYMDEDYATALKFLRPLAARGNHQAQYALGYMCHYGKGLPRDEKRALRWISLAAANGNPKAVEALRRLASGAREDPESDMDTVDPAPSGSPAVSPRP